MNSPVTERRSQPRMRNDFLQNLRIGCYGREVAARLVDVTEGAIGVELFVPLIVGSEVKIDGEFQNADFGLKIRGHGLVRHCGSRADGLFRAGISFLDITCRNLYATENDAA
ncbi:MAG: hypothetical protein HY236_01190 [Acidobacteria bacterium]|nr:hypothetical protein [Acidobacteriota bacterium]